MLMHEELRVFQLFYSTRIPSFRSDTVTGFSTYYSNNGFCVYKKKKTLIHYDAYSEKNHDVHKLMHILHPFEGNLTMKLLAFC